MPENEESGREYVQQQAPAERESATPTVETRGPGPVPTVDARGVGGGMRDTLEGMDAVSRARMVTDMQRRAGNVAVQQVLGQQTAGSVPAEVVVAAKPEAKPETKPETKPDAKPEGSTVAKPASRTAKPKDRQGERDGHDANQALLGSLLDHGSMGSSGATTTRRGPAAAAGDDDPAAPARPAERPVPRRFRPGGFGADEEPEDRTPLSDEALDAELASLWSDGIFRGDAERLAGLLGRAADCARAGELRAFALLAALNERVASVALDLPAEDEGAAPAVAALWLAAVTWRAALVEDVEQAEPGELDAAVAATRAVDPDRAAAVWAWGHIAESEALALQGDVAGSAELLTSVADDPGVPAGAAIAAGVRAGLLDAFVDPTAAQARIAEAGRRSQELDRPTDAVHSLVRQALLDLLVGDRASALLVLDSAAALAGAAAPDALAVLSLRAVLTDATASSVGQVRAVADEAAAAGDYLVAAGSLIACAREQRRGGGGGSAVDALGTLFTGIAMLTRSFGPGTAGPLEYERDDLAASLGPDGFKAAMRMAIERMERGLVPRHGPAAPPA